MYKSRTSLVYTFRMEEIFEFLSKSVQECHGSYRLYEDIHPAVRTWDVAWMSCASGVVECAEKTDVSTPVSFNWSLIHRLTVELVTGLCGFVDPIKRCSVLWGDLRLLVLSTYV